MIYPSQPRNGHRFIFLWVLTTVIVVSSVILVIEYHASGKPGHIKTASVLPQTNAIAGPLPSTNLTKAVFTGDPPGIKYANFASLAAQLPDPFAPCTPPAANAIVCENSKLGNPASEWDIVGAGNANIQGFATEISVNRGEIVRFKIDTSSNNYRLDIYRLGYYGGSGARLITTVQPSAPLPQNQPACLTESATGLVDCGNWAESASWTVPANATSGIYIAKLVREDGVSGVSHIAFIVRDDTGASDLLF